MAEKGEGAVEANMAPMLLRIAQRLVADGRSARFEYTNYRGEHGTRHVVPMDLTHGKTEHHPEAQWLLVAYDLDKQATRYFAMKDISNWRAA